MNDPLSQLHEQTDTRGRLERIVADLRRRQLSTAVEGRVADSMKYAQRVHRLRQLDQPEGEMCCHGCA